MALQGWRFFGVSATIIIYIGGVLFLSMNNIPGSHPKRPRIERFAEQFVSNKLKGWEMMNLSWARNFTGSIKVVFYDDLVHHTERELRSILEFLQFPVNEQLMRCAIMRKEGIFRRKKRLLSFDPYTETMRAEVQSRRRIVYGLLGRQEPTKKKQLTIATMHKANRNCNREIEEPTAHHDM